MKETAIIIGAGPAGLTAAYELLKRTSVKPILIEQTDYVGGISRTVRYKGNRIDIGGHRFFSKSDRVMQWWADILPLEASAAGQEITYQNQRRTTAASSNGSGNADAVMLLRPRKSRIYFMRKFFDYPLRLTFDTLSKLGIFKTIRIGISYMRSMLFPIKPERTLEDFFINRFGRVLYRTFFKSYTEKVWGVPCHEISAEWGAQRIKGLSILKAIGHMVRQIFPKSSDLSQKEIETSLIERFLYPKFGPGQMWEEVADRVKRMGGEIHPEFEVVRIEHDNNRVRRVIARHTRTGEEASFQGNYFFSTMPVKDLTEAWIPEAPATVRQISSGLLYRDFITVGVLCRRLCVIDPRSPEEMISDNWIYIQEPDVLVGRLQIFNNWSPFMVADPSTIWIGLEYFCNEGDDLWNRTDAEMVQLGIQELESMGIVKAQDVLDSTVIRMKKTYPAYFGTYDRFDTIREYVSQFENLFLVGRNGMHKYNNQDHSMLTAMVAVDNIAAGITSKDNIWAVNTESEYHEEKEPQTTSV